MADSDCPKRKLDPRGDDEALTGRNFTEDSDEFVTDAEMEVREANSSPQNRDECGEHRAAKRGKNAR